MRSRIGFFFSLSVVLLSGCGAANTAADSSSNSSSQTDDGNTSLDTVEAKEKCSKVAVPEAVELAEEALFEMINQERSKRKLSRLRRSCRLDEVARKYSKEMGSTKLVQHVSPTSGTPGDRVRAADISFAILTENLAMAPDVDLAHQGLMDSPKHKDNILDERVSDIGVGVQVEHEDEGLVLFATQLFMARPPRVNVDDLAREIFVVANQRRKDAGLSSLGKMKWLDDLAQTRLANCFNEKELPVISLKSAPVSKLRGAVFYLQGKVDVAGILDSREMKITDEESTHLALAIVQGDHPSMGEGTICIKVLFGKKD